jgi:hypothetical protein
MVMTHESHEVIHAVASRCDIKAHCRLCVDLFEVVVCHLMVEPA